TQSVGGLLAARRRPDVAQMNEPNAAAKSAATAGVIDRPTIPRAPETESIRGASEVALLVMGQEHTRNRPADKGRTRRRLPGSYTASMYELKVQREFCAAHALMIKGQREPVHGHNW